MKNDHYHLLILIIITIMIIIIIMLLILIIIILMIMIIIIIIINHNVIYLKTYIQQPEFVNEFMMISRSCLYYSFCYYMDLVICKPGKSQPENGIRVARVPKAVSWVILGMRSTSILQWCIVDKAQRFRNFRSISKNSWEIVSCYF